MFNCTVNALIRPGGWGPLEGGGTFKLERGGYLKFFDRERQNYTMSVEFEMLCRFNNNYELSRYIANSINTVVEPRFNDMPRER